VSTTPQSSRSGRFIRVQAGDEPYAAFHPNPLPPNPPLAIDGDLQTLLDRANQALGRLDGSILLLPDPNRLLYAYVRKEAVLSSQIEGTQSSLSDLLLYEHADAHTVPAGDVRETSNYVAAMDHGIRRLDDGFPLSLRLIREVHGRLMQGTRGDERDPGEFRRSQNWLGGTRPGNARFVPPPAHEVIPAMGALENFIHDEPERTPVLVKAALAHAQFETIHPFLDGNGRVGRLLITLLLYAEEVLSEPLLYLSLYLKRNRDTYYDHLQRVRTHGAWEEWLRFFLEGVVDVTRGATETTRAIVEMIERDRHRVEQLGRATGSTLQVYDLLVNDLVTTIPTAARSLPFSEPTVTGALRRLEDLGIARELTRRPRGRVYAYERYLDLLSEGTEQD
jgi:Fic family protein